MNAQAKSSSPREPPQPGQRSRTMKGGVAASSRDMDDPSDGRDQTDGQAILSLWRLAWPDLLTDSCLAVTQPTEWVGLLSIPGITTRISSSSLLAPRRPQSGEKRPPQALFVLDEKTPLPRCRDSDRSRSWSRNEMNANEETWVASEPKPRTSRAGAIWFPAARREDPSGESQG